MPKLLPYMHVLDFLSAELSNQLLSYAVENREKYTPSRVGASKGQVNEQFRISQVLYDLGPFEALFQEKIHGFFPEMLARLGIANFRIRESLELEIVAHGDGAFFKPHIDMRPGETANRVLSAVYYMHRQPRMFSGGGLRIFPLGVLPGKDRPVVVMPKHNSLLVFQSYVQHEVMPVACPGAAFEDYRFAVNCWIQKA